MSILKIGRKIKIQWHLTVKCQNKCLHCYVSDKQGYQRELKKELTGSELLRSFRAVENSFSLTNLEYWVCLTGGDPFLKSEFWKVLEFLKRKERSRKLVMGNYYFLSRENLTRMKDLGVETYQQSIDGLKSTHDKIRGKNSFRKTLEAVDKINRSGIKSALMFTLTKFNVHELADVMERVSEFGVDYFDFDRCIPLGAGKNVWENFTADEFRQVISVVDKKREEVSKRKNNRTLFGYKSSLWASYLEETGQTVFEDGKGDFGCSAGTRSIAVMADGSIVPCRRFPIVLGNVLEDDIVKIITGNKLMQRLRNTKNYKKCSACSLAKNCRGCPAMAYATSGDCFASDPHCWKILPEGSC